MVDLREMLNRRTGSASDCLCSCLFLVLVGVGWICAAGEHTYFYCPGVCACYLSDSFRVATFCCAVWTR